MVANVSFSIKLSVSKQICKHPLSDFSGWTQFDNFVDNKRFRSNCAHQISTQSIKLLKLKIDNFPTVRLSNINFIEIHSIHVALRGYIQLEQYYERYELLSVLTIPFFRYNNGNYIDKYGISTHAVGVVYVARWNKAHGDKLSAIPKVIIIIIILIRSAFSATTRRRAGNR